MFIICQYLSPHKSLITNFQFPILYCNFYTLPNNLQETLETLIKDATLKEDPESSTSMSAQLKSLSFLGTKMSEIEAKQENMEEMIKVIYNNIRGNNPGMNPLS